LFELNLQKKNTLQPYRSKLVGRLTLFSNRGKSIEKDRSAFNKTVSLSGSNIKPALKLK
jgi:hypothetical protein